MTNTLAGLRDRPAPRRAAPQSRLTPGSRATHHDPRWPAVVAALTALRERQRCAVRIVDADCGAGTLLVEAVCHARSLGFTGIEGRGIDGSPALIGRARGAAARLHEPAIGLVFEATDMVDALESEAELSADIVLWHGDRVDDHRDRALAALAAAGDVVIGDPDVQPAGRSA